MNQLRAKLYELELMKQNEVKQAAEESKSDIGWGSQIRSYVLDQSRIKDLRTNVENTNTGAVLNGDLDAFMGAALAVPHGVKEAVLTIIGVALVSLGHILNLRHVHSAACKERAGD